MAANVAILAIARAHFDNMRNKEITIPEWGDDGAPLVAFYDPPTLNLRQQITQRSGKLQSRQMAVTVILCLKYADGQAVFTDDAPTLAALEGAVDPAVVSRIALEVLGLTTEGDLGN